MKKNLKVEFLISTMFKNDISFLKDMNINSHATIINQTDYERFEEFNIDGNKIKFISTTDRGLSKSRNMALKNAEGDICVICDDDLRYYDNCVEEIQQAYQEIPDADLIVFCYHAEGRQKKSFYKQKKKMNFIQTMKVTSIQITFKRESVVKNNIRFNELFGTGSSFYQSGEENIFLFECLRKGLNIYFVPIYILKVDDNDESTWFKGFNEKFMFDRGAVFTAMSKKFSLLLILQFAIRKYKLYNENLSFMQAFRYMLDGRRDYLGKLQERT